MKLETLFNACSTICKNLSKGHPDRGISTAEGRMTLKDISSELDNLCNWCYKGTIDVEKVVRCKDCKYYKKFKRNLEKNPYDHEVVMLCSKTRTPRQPEFFCADGKERD